MRGQKKGSRNQNENKKRQVPVRLAAGYVLGNAVLLGALLAVCPLLGPCGPPVCWIAGILPHAAFAAAIAGYLRRLAQESGKAEENPGGSFTPCP